MTGRALPLLAAAAIAAEGCGHRRLEPSLVQEPIAPGRAWQSTEGRDHPLVGRIWDVRAARFTDEPTLDAALAGARFVLLGETHDNPDHHLLQARLVRAVVAAGRRPALAFEMLTIPQQPAIDADLARAPRDPDALAKAVRWKDSGWPDFEMYRPIFVAGLDADLPIVAANLPATEVRAIVQRGEEALDPALRARLAKDEPLPEPLLASLRDEMCESHCGELPEKLLDPLVLAQRAKDATMARRMETAGEGRGAILIAGKGHVRDDRGVPFVLAKDAPTERVVAVALEEVQPELTDPAAYAADWGTATLPFDFVVFTPGAKREDPCEGLREKMRKRPGGTNTRQPTP